MSSVEQVRPHTLQVLFMVVQRHWWQFKESLTNSVYLTLRQRWARGAVVHGVR